MVWQETCQMIQYNQLDQMMHLPAGCVLRSYTWHRMCKRILAVVFWLNDQVVVNGTVREYIEIDFEDAFDWFTADDEWTIEVDENQPVLVAESVEITDEGFFDNGLGTGPAYLIRPMHQPVR
jgi:hypothetical protein